MYLAAHCNDCEQHGACDPKKCVAKPSMTLTEILEMCEKATKEPWVVTVKGNTVKSLAIDGVCCGMKIDGKDAAFIALARTELPRLTEVLKRIVERMARACEYDCASCEIQKGCNAGNTKRILRDAGITP